MSILYRHLPSTPGVSIITSTHRMNFKDRLLENYLRQDYPNKELIVVLNNNSLDLADWRASVNNHRDIRVFQLDEDASLGACYNYAASQSSYDLLAKFDDDDWYAAQYLNESVGAQFFSQADIVGKLCRFVYFCASSTLALCNAGMEHQFAPLVTGATMLVKKEVFNKVQFADLTVGEDTEFQKACLKSGFRIYSGSRFQYVTIRHACQDMHTYRIDDDVYLNSGCRVVASTDNYFPYIEDQHESSQDADRPDL